MKHLKRTTRIFTLILGLATSASAAPQIAINNNTFDFGFVPQKATLSHTYWITSIGTDVLKITKVVPGCGCTKAPLASNEIAPGDSTSLEIIFSTKSFRNKITKRPKIYSNASNTAERISFTAFVVSDQESMLPITINPFAVNQFHFDSDNKSATFLIANHSDQVISISIVDFPKNAFSVILPKKIQPHESVEGKILLHEDFKTVSFKKSLTLELDNPEKSRYTIPIVHTIKTLSSR